MEAPELRFALTLAGVPDDRPVAQDAWREFDAYLTAERQLTVREEPARATPGNKGAATDLVVALGASGALQAMVRVVHLWLDRDRRRSLMITWRDGTAERTVDISGENISVDLVEKALDALANPTPPTAPAVDPGAPPS